MNVQFINSLSPSQDAQPSHTHDHGGISHSHGLGEHGHTHEILDHPGTLFFPFINCSNQTFVLGKFAERDLPDYSNRNFDERGFTVGIGGFAISVSLSILLTIGGLGLLVLEKLH